MKTIYLIIILLLIFFIYYNIIYNCFIISTKKKYNNIIVTSESLGLVNDSKIIKQYIEDECNITFNIISIPTVFICGNFVLMNFVSNSIKFNNIIVAETHPIYINKKICHNFILIPNIDHFNMKQLKEYDMVLTKNLFTFNIISPYHNNVINIGFTSLIQPYNKQKNRYNFVHMAGKSPYKGTIRLIEFWKKNKDFMKQNNYYLIIICRYVMFTNTFQYIYSKYNTSIDDNIYHYRTREESHIDVFDCMFHICTSENEGFGHYINEAKSAGCIVITLDNMPMNEIITDDIGFLIKNNIMKKYNNVINSYEFNMDDLIRIFNYIKTCDDNKLMEYSYKSYISFYENHNNFLNNLKKIKWIT